MHYLRLALLVATFGMFNIVSAQNVTSASADEIGQAWAGNKIGAELKYGNKRLQITGVVDSLSSVGGRYYIALKAQGLFLGVYVYLDPSAPLDAVANLSTGQRVTMQCDGMKDSFGIEFYQGRLLKAK